MENTVGQVQNLQGADTPKFTITINSYFKSPEETVQMPNINPQNTDAAYAYPSDYYTKKLAQSQPEPESKPELKAEVQPEVKEETKSTEKSGMYHIKDDIGSLNSYLSDKKHKDIRLLGAKAVIEKLQEDPDKKNDKELNSLINKMLEDNHEGVKFLAIAALESGDAKGNDETVNILQRIQYKKSEDLLDKENSRKASNILMQMTNETAEKNKVENKLKNQKG